MQYCDAIYVALFLPIVIILYQLFKKKRNFILLIASYIFLYATSKELLLYAVASTFSIHHFGLWISDNKKRESDELAEAKKEDKKLIKEKYKKSGKRILFAGILVQVIMLTMTKYLSFFVLNINSLLDALHINFIVEVPKFLAPLGISFYTLMAISYLVDVHRGKIEADRNIGRLNLYLIFFPSIMEGPISRYEEIAQKLWSGEKIHYKNLCFGLQRVIYGLIKKMVIADRLNIVIKNVFADYTKYDGGIFLAITVLYVVQLYMDFSGVMDIACGTGEIFNVNLPENFRQPFFSKNISEFWSRWHITLGTWFKDYIYYPISLSKFSKNLTKKLRKFLGNHFGPMIAGTIALFAVWSLNGLWHGAGYNYLMFGMYHFVFISLGNLVEPLMVKFYKLTKINREWFIVKVIRMIKTSIIVLFGELFFRAETVEKGWYMFTHIFSNFNFKSITNGTLLNTGLNNLDIKDFIIVGITLILVFIVSILREKHISVREVVSKIPLPIRWMLYYILVFYLLTFGAYGAGYVPVDPMYANF